MSAEKATSEEAVLADACAFVRLDGAISWDRWQTLGPLSKVVLAQAVEVVARERSARLVAALADALCAASAHRDVKPPNVTPEDRVVTMARVMIESSGEGSIADEILKADDRAKRNATLKEAAASVLRDMKGGAP